MASYCQHGAAVSSCTTSNTTYDCPCWTHACRYTMHAVLYSRQSSRHTALRFVMQLGERLAEQATQLAARNTLKDRQVRSRLLSNTLHWTGR